MQLVQHVVALQPPSLQQRSVAVCAEAVKSLNQDDKSRGVAKSMAPYVEKLALCFLPQLAGGARAAEVAH